MEQIKKVLSNVSQGLSADEQAQARANIGLGALATKDTASYDDLSSGVQSSLDKADSAVQDANYVHTDNNFTTSEKDKLSGIEAGAEVNVQADWAQTNSSADDFVRNKPANLVQDANYVHTDNNFTTSEKDKLAGIEAGAEVNVQANWNETDSASDSYVQNKPANLVQDANYVHTDNNYTTADKDKLAGITDGAAVANVSWDSTNSKITKTIGSSTTDVVSASTLKTAMSLGNVDNTSDATKKSNFTGSIASGNSGFVTGGDAYTALNGKADKVASATSGNFAGLDANGNLTDSGIKASDFIQKSSTTGLVKNDGSIDTSSYLTTTGAGQNVTSTFTKNAGDNSGMVSGGKLSALFTAISNFFASLKALAFKATVGTSDIDDDAITAAKVKDNETLPVNVSGTAGNIAAGGTSGQYLKSNGANSAPTWEDLPQGSISTDTDESAFDGNTTIATGFSNNKIHLNTASRLWTYIQDRISSVLGLTINSYGGKAAAASVADLANRAIDANSADSVDWANVTNKPATTFIGDYGTTPYNTWFTEYAAGKQLVCRVGPVLNGYTYYYLDMLGQQGTDAITFSRLVSTANVTNATQHISTVVCNPDNSYAIIGNDVSGTTGTYLNLTVGMAKSVGNTSGSDAVALTTAGLGVTNGTKTVSVGNGVVSASDGFIGDLSGNAATATKASVLQDNTISNKTVGATTDVQASASDYVAMWVDNTIVKVHTNKFTAYAAHRDAAGNGIVATYQRKDAIGVGNTTWTRTDSYLFPSSGTVQSSISVGLVSSGTVAMANLIINTTESGTVSGGSNVPGPVILTVMLRDDNNTSTIYDQQAFYTETSQTLSIPLVAYYSGSSDHNMHVCVKMETASGYWKGGISGKVLYINR